MDKTGKGLRDSSGMKAASHADLSMNVSVGCRLIADLQLVFRSTFASFQTVALCDGVGFRVSRILVGPIRGAGRIIGMTEDFSRQNFEVLQCTGRQKKNFF